MSRSLRDYLGADFSAKVRWRMRFERNPLFAVIQDKYAVRAYAQSRGVATAELLLVTQQPQTLLTANLPANCMIKATHGCGWNILRRDGQYFNYGDGRHASAGEPGCGNDADSHQVPFPQTALSEAEVIEMCRRWLGRRYSTREWAYHQIQPRIIAERLLQPDSGPELIDYRFYTFNGTVRAINIGSPTYRRNHQNVFLTPDWTPIQLSRYDERLPNQLPAAPTVLPEMLEAAERLGAEVSFVRVDLYHTSNGVVLGEMTVYPEGGRRGSPTGCRQFNRWLGRQWAMSRYRAAGVAAWNVAGLVGGAVRLMSRRPASWRRRTSETL